MYRIYDDWNREEQIDAGNSCLFHVYLANNVTLIVPNSINLNSSY